MKKITLCITLIILSVLATNAQNQVKLLKKAQVLASEGNNTEAIKLYDEFTTKNPYLGDGWFEKALLHFEQTNYIEAIDNAKKSYEAGYKMPQSAQIIALSFASINKQQEALQWLEKAARLNIGSISDFNDIPNWKEIAINYPNNPLVEIYNNMSCVCTERISQWHADIDIFSSKAALAHFHLFNTIEEQEWEKEIETIKNDISKISDKEIIIRLMKLAVRVGDGHTLVVPPFQGKNQFQYFPISFELFSDGLFIIAAAKEYEDLIGKKVLKIGNKTVDELYPIIKKITPHDNALGIKWGFSMTLNIAELMQAEGVIENTNQMDLTIAEKGKNKKITLTKTEPLTEDYLGSLLFYGVGNLEWKNMLSSDKLALYQQKTTEPYWYKFINDSTLHFAFNQIRSGEVPFRDFTEKMIQESKDRGAKKLIIDLRNNEGGDLTMTFDFVKKLIGHPDFSEPGNLYVFIGRRTFSAAGYFTGLLNLYFQPIFIGEPTGTKPNFIGESGGVFVLPHSGLSVNFSNLYHQSTFAQDRRNWIAPDIFIEISSEDYRLGRDPLLEEVLRN